MKHCYDDTQLQLWLDEEAGGEQDAIGEHVATCLACSCRLNTWRDGGQSLRDLVDASLDDIDPLQALPGIHERIAEQRARFPARIFDWSRRNWRRYRGTVAAMGVAAAFGFLCAPGVSSWLLGGFSYPVDLSMVDVESLEMDGYSQAAVIRPAGGQTTIIWWEPHESASNIHPEDG